MAKKTVKILSMILLACVIVASLAQVVLADNLSTSMFDNYTDNSGAANSVTKVIGAVLNVTRIVGYGVAVIMLIVLAIKYISAAPGDKADIKKHAVVYVVGAVVLFAASGLLGIIQKFADNVKAE